MAVGLPMTGITGTFVSASNQAQIEYWNGRAGEKWAALQISLDVMLAPATAELQARAGPVSGLRVLDIGCGTGETCAIWLSGGATVTGVDVSAPMLAVAADRTDGKVRLVAADASVFRGDAPFDLAVSRFGVMFFADPLVAFANIAANLRPGGRLLFTCWRAAADNQWVSTPMAAIPVAVQPIQSLRARASETKRVKARPAASAARLTIAVRNSAPQRMPRLKSPAVGMA